jgi:hypothetical protein
VNRRVRRDSWNEIHAVALITPILGKRQARMKRVESAYFFRPAFRFAQYAFILSAAAFRCEADQPRLRRRPGDD